MGSTGARRGNADNTDAPSSVAFTDVAGRGGQPIAATRVRELLQDSYGLPAVPGWPTIIATTSVPGLGGLSSTQRVSESTEIAGAAVEIHPSW